ncbi:MAG: alpha/beta fold hydrolase [Rhizobacter sp.]
MLALAVASAIASAKVIESQIDVPVSVQDAYRKTVAQTIRVTVFVDDATPAPHPLIVINHGRGATAAERADVGRARYSDNSRYFARLGFVVAVPTRVGYGVSGGEDVEDSGDCQSKRYLPGYLAAAHQTLSVIDALKASRTDLLKDRIVVLGQSYGGTTAATLASLNPEGVVAAINFAGGGGGNPKTIPRNPCGTPQLERMFRGYGETARVPMLWIYTENDMYFGASLPREWFQAYRAKNAPARMVQFPPHGEDGHSLFTRFPEVWKPEVEAFLREQGFQWDKKDKVEQRP